MSKKEEKVVISSEKAEKDLHIDKRPADKWMKQTKYKIYMDLVDQAYELEFEADIEDLAGKYDLTQAAVKRYIHSLSKEYLVSKRKVENDRPDVKAIAKKYDLSEKTLNKYIDILTKENVLPKYKTIVSIPGLFVGRKGQPICAFCGSELEDVKEKVTKNGFYVLSGKCPVCKKGTGQFRTKATIKGE